MPNLYSEYRPYSFGSIVGQDHIVKMLVHSVREGTVAHAYLFQGPAGTGKTSMARILARTINCLNIPNSLVPCEKCKPCKLGDQDLIEIDAASNRSIDDIHELQDKINYKPRYATTRVVIIDEWHQLTIQAINSLLKTVEEPPTGVMFIFCSTNTVSGATQQQAAMRVLASRLMSLNFKPMSIDILVGRLNYIYGVETGGKVDNQELKDGLVLLAHRAKGSMRDCINLLETFITTFGDSKEVPPEAMEWLFPPEERAALNLVELLSTGSAVKALPAVYNIRRLGMSPSTIVQYTVELLSDVLDLQLNQRIYRPQDMGTKLQKVASTTDVKFTTHALRCLGPIKNSDEYTDLNIVIANITEPWEPVSEKEVPDAKDMKW